MSKEPRASLRQFVQDYRRIRFAEGFASTDPSFARQLPFRDVTGRNAAIWRIRAFHYLLLRAGLSCLPGVNRVLDAGAGNGWLSRRLAARYRVTALDVDTTDAGLGAIDDPRVGRVCADLESLPFAAGTFDVVIVAATLHYAVDLSHTLRELARVLRSGGVLVIADSPVYPDAMARHRAWQRTVDYYSAAGAAHLAQRYRGLIRSELDGCACFRFVTLSPGIGPWRAALGRLRASAPGPRMPLLFGWKR